MIVRLFAYSQTILSPRIIKINSDTLFCVSRSHLDSINFSFEKNKIYASQINILDSLKKKCEYMNSINLKVIANMDSIDYSRIQEINKLNQINSNLRKKHKLEFRQFQVKQIKKTIIIVIGVSILTFIIGASI